MLKMKQDKEERFIKKGEKAIEKGGGMEEEGETCKLGWELKSDGPTD